MVFAYDSELSLQAATELVNTAAEPDTLTTRADLDDFLSRYRFTGRHDRTEAELAAVRDLRPRLRALLLAERDDAVGLVNEILAEVTLRPGWCATRSSTGTCTRSTTTTRWRTGSRSRPRWR